MNGITKSLLLVLICIFLISFISLTVIRSVKTTKNALDSGTVTSDIKSGGIDTSDIQTLTETEAVTEPPFSLASDYSAKQIFIYDLDNSRMIYEKGTEENIRPASITKLAVATYALSVMPSDTVITPGDEVYMIEKGSSTAYVRPNHKLTLSMLVEAMIVKSGNDAAYAVAGAVARYVSGNDQLVKEDAVNYFMSGLNTFLKNLGCTNTVFTVPDGFALEGHYSTAHDLIVIASAARQNEIIMKYASTVSERVTYASGHKATWENTNSLINPESEFYRECVYGLKTGSLTDDYSVMVTAKINDVNYLIGVFCAPDNNERYVTATGIISELEAIKK